MTKTTDAKHAPRTGQNLRAWGLLLVTSLFVIAPIFATSFRGYAQEDFPNSIVDLPGQPAGWAFSIWSVIYVGLIVSAIYGVFKAANDDAWDRIRVPMILSVGLGVTWLEVAQSAPVWATVQIFAMAGTAIWAVLRLPIERRALLDEPIGLYAGWVTAAAGVSLCVVLTGYGVMKPDAAAIFCLLLICVVAVVVISFSHTPRGYPLAVSWAFFGVLMANIDNGMMIPSLAGLAISAIALVALTGRNAR
ncbi:TspO/MBR family protein [Albirhodobacter sp. R86504]|jgi:hypothetical protein|uniref:TspO/MBR family protein n=1 Tax=Albirhodobacter sp. R86504 TaxID=3093848 RepID=UPI00366C81C5